MDADLAVLKLDSTGQKVWSKVIGGTLDDELLAIVPNNDGGCYVIGYTASNDFDCSGFHFGTGGLDGYLARLDKYGNILWHKDLGGSSDDGQFGNAVANGKGGVLVTFSSNSDDGDVHHHHGGDDYWVLEVDSTGTILWDNCFGSAIHGEDPASICKANDGSIWVTGESSAQSGQVDTSYGNGDAWVVHADSIGNIIGAKVIGSTGFDKGMVIYPLLFDTVIIGGLFSKSDANFSSILSYNIWTEVDAFLGVLTPISSVGTSEIGNQDDILSLFPNPAKNNVEIESKNDRQLIIIIKDVTGKEHYRSVFKNKLELNIGGWTSGIYFAQLINMQGVIIKNKFFTKT